MSIYTYALVSVSLVGLVSFVTVIAIPVKERTLAKMIFFLAALAAGAMLGNAFVHQLPEAFAQSHHPILTSSLICAGFMLSFLLQKVLNAGCHHSALSCGKLCDNCPEAHGLEKTDHVHAACEGHDEHGAHEHVQGCCRDRDEHHDDEWKLTPLGSPGHIHHTGWMSLMAHGMDNLTDGILIGISYLVSVEVGMVTTLAIVLHEIPMELGGCGILVNAGFKKWQAVAINFASAVVAALGTCGVLFLGQYFKNLPEYFTPVGAGVVVYLTAVGLIPQLQQEKNPKRSLIQFLVMTLGLAAMIAAKFFE